MASVVYKGSEGGAAPKTNQDVANAAVKDAIKSGGLTNTDHLNNINSGVQKPTTSTASKQSTTPNQQSLANDYYSNPNRASGHTSAAGSSGNSVNPQALAEQYYSNPDRAASHNGATNTPTVTGGGEETGNTGAGAVGSGSPGGGYSGGGFSGGGGSNPSGNGTQTVEEEATTEPEKSQEEQLRDAWAAAGEVTKRIVEGATPEDIDISAIDKVDVNELESKLEQIRQIQEQRATGQIDYAVEHGVNDVNRAVEDAAPQFQTQRNQISADEQRALDNQVLYAEARGDRGGIGQSQYASIQNNAATNRYRVNQEQTKLSTDAARQIADLRAKGEFEKADSLLQISQNYLSELKALEQWALQTNLGVDEFNTQLEQWLANYNMSRDQFLINAEMSAANMTGAFSDGTPTLAARDKVEAQLANAAQALFQLGLPLTDEQISALGWTKGQYTQYMNEQAVANAAGGVDITSLPIYWTDDDTGKLEQITGAEYRELINNNVVRR